MAKKEDKVRIRIPASGEEAALIRIKAKLRGQTTSEYVEGLVAEWLARKKFCTEGVTNPQASGRTGKKICSKGVTNPSAKARVK